MKAICAYCGKVISKRPAVIKKQKHVFCNRVCSGKYVGTHSPKQHRSSYIHLNKLFKLAELYKLRQEYLQQNDKMT